MRRGSMTMVSSAPAQGEWPLVRSLRHSFPRPSLEIVSFRPPSIAAHEQARQLRQPYAVSEKHHTTCHIAELEPEKQELRPQRPFGVLNEVGFCLSMALTQFLGEYLISGFSALWPSLQKEFNDPSLVAYWPASLLSLVLCATILTFARVTDMYGGFYVCCGGVAWLALWTLAAGFAPNIATLDVCRAMQGLAVAAYTPSCLALFSSIYPSGRRRNIMLGVYGACAPIGFFAGITVSAALPEHRWQFYFWIPSMLAVISLVLLALCTPRDTELRDSWSW